MQASWLILALSLAAASAADFAGPERCRPCHPSQYQSQAASRHAMALRPITETALASLFAAQPLRERSGISFEYEPAPGGLQVRTLQGKREASALLQWAFGAGAQAVTPVGISNGRFIEHRISWYTAAQGARRTMGHPGEPSPNPVAALGIVQDDQTIYRCFHCHATAVKPGPDLSALIPGVTCERCHGAAASHAARGTPATRPAADQRAVMELCGSCHRLPARSGSRAPEIDDPMSIRFAPVGLAASACYRKSEALTCLTCHDPHQDAEHDARRYEAKCTSCHQQQTACGAGRTTGCLGCHMRKQSPAPWLTFTDHRIRIYTEGLLRRKD